MDSSPGCAETAPFGSAADAWPSPARAVSTALGRHALSLVARHLRRRGIRQVAVPDYHCLTMVSPFQLEGFHIAHVATDLDLMADPEDLWRTIHREPREWAVLHCEVFGAPPTDRLTATLSRTRAAGATLVVDDTHRWPQPPATPADHVVVSARKLLDLPDGAFATGPVAPGAGDPDGARRRIPRSDLDRQETQAWLDGDVDRAEELMDRQFAPAGMSPQARSALAGIDLDAVVARRRSTARVLREVLHRHGLAPFPPDVGHFCVAFRHPDAEQLIVNLARAGVDGPVWWPRPTGWTRPWPDDVVTVPVDGGPDVVTRTAAALDRVLGAPSGGRVDESSDGAGEDRSRSAVIS